MLTLQAASCKLHAGRSASMRSKPVAALARRPGHRQAPQPASRLRQPVPGLAVQDGEVPPGLAGASAAPRAQALIAGRSSPGTTPGTVTLASATHDPEGVHFGPAQALRDARAATLDAACLARPDRFKRRRPQPYPLPAAACSNPPPTENLTAETTPSCTANS